MQCGVWSKARRYKDKGHHGKASTMWEKFFSSWMVTVGGGETSGKSKRGKRNKVCGMDFTIRLKRFDLLKEVANINFTFHF